MMLLSRTLTKHLTQTEISTLFDSIGVSANVGGSKRDYCLAHFGEANRASKEGAALCVQASLDMLASKVSEWDSGDIAGEIEGIRSEAIRAGLVRDKPETVIHTGEGETMANAGEARIFISHATGDKDFVDKFIDLLQTGINGLTQEHIFCTSLEGMRIPEGKDFIQFIKGELRNPALVISLISPAYYESAFCLCELGATWAMGHSSFPLLLPPYTFADLRAVLQTTQARRIDDAAGLSVLRDRIIEVLRLPHGSTSRWEGKRNEFLTNLEDYSKKLGKGHYVSVDEHSALQDELKATTKALEQAKQSAKDLDEALKKVSALKDRQEVVRVAAKGKDPFAELLTLTTQIKHRLRVMPKTVHRVLIDTMMGREHRLGTDWEFHGAWEEANKAAQEDFVMIDGNQISLNDEDPTIKKVVKEISQVQEYLEKQDDAFVEAFQEKFGMRPRVANARFFVEFFGV